MANSQSGSTSSTSYRSPLSLFSRLSLFSVAATLLFSTEAISAPIHQETFTGNGESRVLTSRTITASEGGRYFLTLKNGDLGPRSIEQCETEDTVELKRECLFNNLTEKIDQDFSRIQDALIHLNGVRVRNHLAPNEKTITRTRGLLKIPVNLVQGANTLNIDLLGYSTSRLFLDLEKAPETPLPPFAAFTLNRLKGNTTQSFTLNARESFSPEAGTLTYSWLWGDEPEGTLPTIGTSTATHIYQTAGTYRAKLIVTDTVSNLSSEFGIDLVVTAIDPVNPPENEKPRPVIQMALDSENPMRIHLNGLQSTDDGTITNYAWRITNQSGQHTNLIGETLSYTFTQSGSYTIRLTVTDDLGLKASLDRVTSVAPLSLLVRDEILFSPKQYFGTFETEAQTIEPLNIPQAKLAVLKIQNADGEDHLIEDCSTIGWPEKIGCLYTNLVNSTYIKLYRVNTANVYVNGRKVTDSTSITKQKKYFETIISLDEVNTLDIRVRGWPTAFISLEVQALETNIAPIASFTFPQPTRGVPQAIEFNAASSTDENDQIVSYRFLAKKSGETSYSYDSDWIATANHQITFTEAGTWDVVASARDKFGAIGTTSQQLEILPNTLPTLTAVYNILSNQSPFRVQVRATGQDQDGDALQYNFSFSNGQTTGFQSSNIAISNFAASGQQQVVVTVRDQSGGESSTTLNFELGNNLIPIASFAFATARAGYAPLTVAFDASSSSDPDGPTENLRYFWQFGDGTPLTEGKILEHTFQNGGEYIVTLSVVDAFRGTGTQSRAVFSWVTAPPIPRYTVTPIPGTLQVTFDASGSTPGDSAIQSYAFEPGNGQTIRQASPVYTHTYLNGGVYSTSLRVYDLEGDANITGQVINVFNGQKPAANINLVSSDVITPATFVFNANGSATPNAGATLNGWKWTLPNGEVRLGPNMTYTTSLNGTFDITLEVRDSLGFWSDPVTRTYAAATGVLPIANITASKTTALVGEVIQFSGLNSYTLNAGANLVTYEWTTPSGSTLFGPEVQFGLNSQGLKTVTLKVTDSKGYVSEIKSIQINVIEPAKPVAVMALADGGNIIPVTRHGDARGSYAVAAGATITGYEWRIVAPEALPSGIDFSLFGPEVDILFNQEVTYTVSLRVFDSQGGTSDWVSETFGPLQNTKPIAIMNPQTLTTVAPSMVFFTSFGSSDPDGHTIINYYWNFGDGTESYEPSVNHYYENPGVYHVELSVQDQFGKWSDSIFGVVTVTENVAPIAIITMENDPAGNRFKKLFSASQSSDSDGSIVNYSWYIFGSGVFATGVNTEFTFPGPGTYTMGLDVYDDKGARTQASYLVEIGEDLLPNIIANFEVDDVNPMKFKFDASRSTDDGAISSFSWKEGTTTLSSASIFEYTFESEGAHTIQLEVTDNGGQVASKTFNVYASTLQLANFSLEQDSERISFIDNDAQIGSSISIPISRIPTEGYFRPETRNIGTEHRYSWEINGINIGTENLPNVEIENQQQTSARLFVKDENGNVLAKVVRNFDFSSTDCSYDEIEAVCVDMPNSDTGVDITTNDLTFTIPTISTIESLQNAQIVLGEDEIIDLTSDTTFDGNTVTINRARLNSALSNFASETNIEATVFDGEKSVTGRIPVLRFLSASISLPSGRSDLLYSIRNLESGRTLHREVAPGTIVRVASGSYKIEGWNPANLQDTFWESQLIIRHGNSIVLALGDEDPSSYSSPLVISGISSQTFNASAANQKSSFSSQSIQSLSNGLLDRTSGIVAYFISDRAEHPTSIDENDYKISKESWGVNSNTVDAFKGSMKKDYVPWLQSPYGVNPATTHSIECRAFDKSWDHNGKIGELEGLYQGHLQTFILFEKYRKVVTPIEAAMVSQINILKDDFFLRQFCGTNGQLTTAPSGSPRCIYRLSPEDRANVNPQYAGAMDALIASYGSWESQTNSYSASALPYSVISQQYLDRRTEYGFAGENWRDLTVKTPVQVEVIAKMFTSSQSQPASEFKTQLEITEIGFRGNYQTPENPTGALPPVDVFSISGLLSKRLDIQTPANLTKLEFEIIPKNNPKFVSAVKAGNPQNFHSSLATKRVSIACRMSEPAISVRGFVVDIDSINSAIPLSLDDAFNIGKNLISGTQSFGFTVSKNQIVKEVPLLHLPLFKFYAANSFATATNFIPTDLDTLTTIHPDNQPNINFAAIDSSVRNSLNTQTADFPIQIEVTHPPGAAPPKLEIEVRSEGSDNFEVLETGPRSKSNAFDNVSLYETTFPTSSAIARNRTALSAIIQSGTIRDPNTLVTIRPVTNHTGPISPKLVKLKSLLNARYLDFVETSGAAKRRTYGGNVSPFIASKTANLVRTIDRLTNDLSDFSINDGTGQFGGRLFGHEGHNNGTQLDVRTFGLVSPIPTNYDTVNKDGVNGAMFPNRISRHRDVIALSRAVRIAYLTNQEASPSSRIPTTASCEQSRLSGSGTCAISTQTIERCLFNDEPSTSLVCDNIRSRIELADVVSEKFSIASIRASHVRLRTWILRNRIAIKAVADEVRAENLGTFKILFSSGEGASSRKNFLFHFNDTLGGFGKIDVLMDPHLQVPRDWQVTGLMDGNIPFLENSQPIIVDSSLEKRFVLIDEQNLSIGTNVGVTSSFSSYDKTDVHLDHYHINFK